MIVPAALRVTLTFVNSRNHARRRLIFLNKTSGLIRITCCNYYLIIDSWFSEPGRSRTLSRGEVSAEADNKCRSWGLNSSDF